MPQDNHANAADAHVVKSAARTLEILEYFDEVREPANIADVSGALGYPQSSTSALLRSLVSLGYLQFDRYTRRFFPTDRVTLLGSWLNPALYAQGKLTRLIETVAQRTQKFVVVAARNGDAAQYIYMRTTPGAVDYQIRIGSTRPLAKSATGLALLSAFRDEDVRKLFHRINAYAHNAHDNVRVSDLLETLTTVRATGFAVSLGLFQPQIGMVSMLLPPEYTDRPLAIGVGGRLECVAEQQDDIKQTLLGAVRECLGDPAPHAVNYSGARVYPRLPAQAPAGYTETQRHAL